MFHRRGRGGFRAGRWIADGGQWAWILAFVSTIMMRIVTRWQVLQECAEWRLEEVTLKLIALGDCDELYYGYESGGIHSRCCLQGGREVCAGAWAHPEQVVQRCAAAVPVAAFRGFGDRSDEQRVRGDQAGGE